MRLIAGLAWFQESPSFLAATISSLTKIGVDHVVALDGAYALFPGGQGNSGFAEASTILSVCESLDIGVTLHAMPTARRYEGGEVEKRGLLFDFVSAIAEPGDWYLSIDADEVIHDVMCDVRAELEATTLDTATCTLSEPVDVHKNDWNLALAMQSAIPNEYRSPATRFFRVLPDFRVESNHYTYVAGRGEDEKILWAAGMRPAVDTLDLQGRLIIQHRDKMRAKHRDERKWNYYRARDAAGIETQYTEGLDEE